MRTSKLQRLQEYQSLVVKNANGGLLNKGIFKRYRKLHAEFGQKPPKKGLNAVKTVDNQYPKTLKIEG